MQFNGSDPPNGAPVADLLMTMLRRQDEKTDWIILSIGGMRQQLKDGQELHRELIKAQQGQGLAIRRIDEAHRKTQRQVRQLKRRHPAALSVETVKEYLETVKETWHYLLLAAALVGKVIQWLLAHIGPFGAG